MTKNKTTLLSSALLVAGIAFSSSCYAQQWPQGEQAYMPSTQSPQWVDSNRSPNVMQNTPNPAMMAPPAMPSMPPQMAYPSPQFRYMPPQPPMQPYMPQYRPNPGQPYFGQPFMPQTPYRGNTGWGSWPNNMNSNRFMPGMNMGNWSMPNMDMGNWSMPEMPEMNNMPGMPNMDNFEMPSPSFEMPSPSFTTPNMNMPFNNQW